jgi:CDP-diacylglycerol---serine O-phosphatidyltransferase
MRLTKALFVLPSLFTLSSVLMGLVSLVAAAEGDFRLAALTIFFGVLFDSLDGGVARMTRTQSKFGIQIDSLADVITFGVAPAVLIYLAFLKGRLMWGSVDMGFVAAFAFLAAGTVRLARYNVQAERKVGPMTRFTGLPIPAGAGCLAGLVFGVVSEGRGLPPGVALAFLLLLALLMVTSVPFRKKVTMRDPLAATLVVLLALTLVIVAIVRPAFTPFAFFAYYTALGLAESSLRRALRFGRRVRANRRARLHDRDSH